MYCEQQEIQQKKTNNNFAQRTFSQSSPKGKENHIVVVSLVFLFKRAWGPGEKKRQKMRRRRNKEKVEKNINRKKKKENSTRKKKKNSQKSRERKE